MQDGVSKNISFQVNGFIRSFIYPFNAGAASKEKMSKFLYNGVCKLAD